MTKREKRRYEVTVCRGGKSSRGEQTKSPILSKAMGIIGRNGQEGKRIGLLHPLVRLLFASRRHNAQELPRQYLSNSLSCTASSHRELFGQDGIDRLGNNKSGRKHVPLSFVVLTLYRHPGLPRCLRQLF